MAWLDLSTGEVRVQDTATPLATVQRIAPSEIIVDQNVVDSHGRLHEGSTPIQKVRGCMEPANYRLQLRYSAFILSRVIRRLYCIVYFLLSQELHELLRSHNVTVTEANESAEVNCKQLDNLWSLSLTYIEILSSADCLRAPNSRQ